MNKPANNKKPEGEGVAQVNPVIPNNSQLTEQQL
jgi:hypothetical protein